MFAEHFSKTQQNLRSNQPTEEILSSPGPEYVTLLSNLRTQLCSLSSRRRRRARTKWTRFPGCGDCVFFQLWTRVCCFLFVCSLLKLRRDCGPPQIALKKRGPWKKRLEARLCKICKIAWYWFSKMYNNYSRFQRVQNIGFPRCTIIN